MTELGNEANLKNSEKTVVYIGGMKIEPKEGTQITTDDMENADIATKYTKKAEKRARAAEAALAKHGDSVSLVKRLINRFTKSE